MPLYDFACPGCGATFEDLVGQDVSHRPCPVCGHKAARLLSIGRAYRTDAPWLESVAAVAEKGSGKAHVEAFLANPSRTTYRDWMHGEDIRPLEPGEGHRPSPGLGSVRREVLERFQARRGVS
jgi:putative FmdB family regulatory protein